MLRRRLTIFSSDMLRRADVEVELVPKDTCAPHLDIDLKPCTRALQLSITADVRWRKGLKGGARRWQDYSFGQCVDTVREIGKHLPWVGELCDIWERWHLNNMISGCREQRDALKSPEFKARVAKTHDHYNESRAFLAEEGLLVCNGYSWGSAWLTEIIPDEVVKRLTKICTPPELVQPTSSEDNQANWEARGLTMKAERIDERPDGLMDSARGVRHWRLTLTCKGRKMTTYYSQGAAITERPQLDTVMESLLEDARIGEMDFEEFCRAFGYDADSRAHYKVWQACVDIRQKLANVLGIEESALEAL